MVGKRLGNRTARFFLKIDRPKAYRTRSFAGLHVLSRAASTFRLAETPVVPDYIGVVDSASGLVDGDWRGEVLARVRALIRAVDPEIVEELKWRGTPVFSHGGIVCTGETYKSVVKLTFAQGAALPDPAGLFNSSLEGNVRRAIDIREGEGIDEAALQDLIRAAVALNLAKKPRSRRRGVA